MKRRRETRLFMDSPRRSVVGRLILILPARNGTVYMPERGGTEGQHTIEYDAVNYLGGFEYEPSMDRAIVRAPGDCPARARRGADPVEAEYRLHPCRRFGLDRPGLLRQRIVRDAGHR